MRELSLNMLDIAQNSIAAGATLVTLTVDCESAADRLTLTVEDNGRGMTAEQLARVRDPFFTTLTTRKVGMGIPLFRMAARDGRRPAADPLRPGRGHNGGGRFYPLPY